MRVYLFLGALIAALMTACSFDYGTAMEKESNRPDIAMENVEYVRVRGGNPLMKFNAESAERYEERKIMNLRSFTFEQFESRGTEVNAVGEAGEALVELDTGNINLFGGVKIEVDSEDIVIETSGLHWQDAEKQLSGEENQEVEVHRSDGTNFTGRGFSANIRERTWEFATGAEGSYTEKEDGEAL